MTPDGNGRLIVIAGIDGSGKSTQTDKLFQRLKNMGYKVAQMHFPNYDGPMGKFIKDFYLTNNFGEESEEQAYAAATLCACDRWLSAEKIKRFLTEGYILILDRYVESNLACQGCKIKSAEARKEFYRWDVTLEHYKLGLPHPNLSLILHVSVNTSLKRIDDRLKSNPNAVKSLHDKDADYFTRMETVYREIAKEYAYYHIISCETDECAQLSEDAVAELIWEEVQKALSL